MISLQQHAHLRKVDGQKIPDYRLYSNNDCTY